MVTTPNHGAAPEVDRLGGFFCVKRGQIFRSCPADGNTVNSLGRTKPGGSALPGKETAPIARQGFPRKPTYKARYKHTANMSSAERRNPS